VSRLRILLIDDDPAFRARFVAFGADLFDTATAATGEEGLARLRAEPPDAVLLDIEFERGPDGFEILRAIRQADPDVPVLMVTGDDRRDTAARAIAAGADDFITKSPDLGVLEARIHRAREISAWRAHARTLQSAGTGELLGDSAPMRRLREEIARVGPKGVRVLVRGETGSGKELVARALHASSPRRDEKFLPISAAEATDELFDSTLFGHERGAFTGADQRRLGRLELAHRGTLFLDEVGKSNLMRQGKLHRVLDTGRFTRLGGHEEIPVDVRWITAANENLEARIQEGRFLEDLYHRLADYTIFVPPLRDRLEDVPRLVRALADAFTRGRVGERRSRSASRSRLARKRARARSRRQARPHFGRHQPSRSGRLRALAARGRVSRGASGG